MTENTPNDSLSDTSGSFIILGKDSLVSAENEQDKEKTQQENAEPSTTFKIPGEKSQTPISDSEPSKTFYVDIDAQQKLNQLLRENYQLKETLSQNNLAIKTQLNIFFMWQQEVLKTHETHKQKFLETKDLILKLRAENLNLKMQLEKNSSNFSLLNDNDFESDKSYISSSPARPTQSFVEVEKLKEEVKRFEDMYNDLKKKNESLSIENSSLQKTIKQSKQEMLKVNKELEEVEKENVYLKQKSLEQQKTSNDSFVSYTLPNSEAHVHICNLMKQLEGERDKVAQLKQKLEKTKADSVDGKSGTPTEELNQYLNELNDMDASFKKQSQRIHGLSSWIYLTEEKLGKAKLMGEDDDNTIKSEIEQLKNQLMKEGNVVKEKEQSLQEMHKQFNRLLNDYKELQGKLISLEESSLNIKSHESAIESLSLKLKSKDEELEAKDAELIDLKEKIKKLKVDCEEIAILKVQAEVYQTDFRDERAAREKLVGEKEELAEQIRLLQTVIKDLEREEKEKVARNEESNQNVSNSTRNSSSENQKSRFVCPKCMFSFSDLKLCEEHIDECIDIHMYP